MRRARQPDKCLCPFPLKSGEYNGASTFDGLTSQIRQDSANGLFKLTENPRKVLGYLPKDELARVNELCLGPMRNLVEKKRAELRKGWDDMRASEADRIEEGVDRVITSTTYFFKDLEAHFQATEKWM